MLHIKGYEMYKTIEVRFSYFVQQREEHTQTLFK